MTIWAYYRVSTELQDYNSQKTDVLRCCKQFDWNIDKEIIDDGVSGKIEAKKRNLNIILKKAVSGDILITSELSRLGRSTYDVLNTCKILIDKGIKVWFVKQGMGLDNTPIGKVITTIFIAFSELERDLISQRTKDGLRRVKEQGKILGRPKGGKNTYYILDKYKEDIKKYFLKGDYISDIARKLHLHRTTLRRYINNNIELLEYEKKAIEIRKTKKEEKRQRKLIEWEIKKAEIQKKKNEDVNKIIDLKVKELQEKIEKIKNGEFNYKQARRRYKEELK